MARQQKMEQECVNRWLEKEEKNEKKGMKENKIMKGDGLSLH